MERGGRRERRAGLMEDGLMGLWLWLGLVTRHGGDKSLGGSGLTAGFFVALNLNLLRHSTGGNRDCRI